MKAKIVLLIVMLLTSMTVVISADDGYQPLAPNSMGFTLDSNWVGATPPFYWDEQGTSQDVTVGDTFFYNVYADITSAIDTVAVDNMTFLPAGILHVLGPRYSDPSFTPNMIKGNLLSGSTVFIYPYDGNPNSIINNASGWAKPWVWGQPSTVNNTGEKIAFNIEWYANSCGVATLTITAGGTAYGGYGGVDPGTTKYDGTIYVHPESTGSFLATPNGYTQIDLSWAKFTGDDRVVIRYNTASPAPTTPTSGTLLYNNTGTSTSHGGLTSGDHIWYSIWGYNVTANLYSLYFQSDDALVPFPNNPPTFGTPSPTNGSTGRPLSLLWSIPINDPDGDTFNWSIACSNGHGTSATGESNGTKAFLLSGLSYSTTYKVWVNATDSGSGQWTRKWYTFQTVANQPPNTPGGSDITPRNSVPNVPINIGFLRVMVADPESQSMDVAFYWGNTTLIGTDTAVASGSTATIPIPTLAYNTTYYWYVSIDDKHGGVTRGPTSGNWSYTTGVYVPIPPGGPSIHMHNFYVTVIDDATNLPIVSALCKVMKGNDFQGQGLTSIYGTWSGQFKDSDRYTLTVTANGYQDSITPFTLSQKDTFMTIRMTTTPAPVGLTNAQGGLTTVGFIFLAILILTLLGVLFVWYNYYGGKSKKR